MTNEQKLFATPYGDNLVARCDYCGKPVFKCTCEVDEVGAEDYRYNDMDSIDETNAFDRNFSDADPGL